MRPHYRLTALKEREVAMGDRNACTVRAVGVVCGLDYDTAYKACGLVGRKHRQGYVMVPTLGDLGVLLDYDFEAQDLTSLVKRKGSGYTMVTIGRAFPVGKYLVFVNGHVAPMVHGIVYDWTRGRRHRVKSVWRATPATITLRRNAA